MRVVPERYRHLSPRYDEDAALLFEEMGADTPLAKRKLSLLVGELKDNELWVDVRDMLAKARRSAVKASGPKGSAEGASAHD